MLLLPPDQRLPVGPEAGDDDQADDPEELAQEESLYDPALRPPGEIARQAEDEQRNDSVDEQLARFHDSLPLHAGPGGKRQLPPYPWASETAESNFLFATPVAALADRKSFTAASFFPSPACFAPASAFPPQETRRRGRWCTRGANMTLYRDRVVSGDYRHRRTRSWIAWMTRSGSSR